MTYSVLHNETDETEVLVSSLPENVLRQYELSEAVPRASDWPDSVAIEFSEHRPDGLQLTDVIENTLGLLIVSTPFRRVVEEIDAKDIEFLPVSIVNHRGRLAADAYWIANHLQLSVTVDREASVYEDSAGLPGQIFSFDKLVVHPDLIAAGPALLRMAEQPMFFMVRQDLEQAMMGAGLTGITFIAANGFSGGL